MQKNGAGIQTASACFWDSTTDGTFCGRFIVGDVTDWSTDGSTDGSTDWPTVVHRKLRAALGEPLAVLCGHRVRTGHLNTQAPPPEGCGKTVASAAPDVVSHQLNAVCMV